MSNLGNKLRNLVDEHFPERVSRAVSYSELEAEITIKFKDKLPTASKGGWLIAEIMKEMEGEGYLRFSNVYSSIEGGVKMTLAVKAKRPSKNPNAKPSHFIEEEDDSTVGSISEKKEEEEYIPTVAEEPKLNTDKEDKVQSLVLAMEYGYLQCEKGNNLTQAIINFNNTLSGKK